MELVLDALKKHWSVLIVALLVGFYSVRLWPASSERGAQPVAGALQPTVERSEVDPALAQRKTDNDELPRRPEREVDETTPFKKKKFELREKPIFVEDRKTELSPGRTYDSNSPEVKQALLEVEVEIFAAPGSEDAEEAKRLLEHNKINFVFKDTSDPMLKERARRVSGSTEGTVIVVDGQVLSRYSSESMQKALVTAVEKRIQK